MSNEEYRLHYGQREDVVFPSQKGMKRYLTNELNTWAPFLDYVRQNLGESLVSNHGRRQWTAEQLADAFELQLKLLADRAKFNRSTIHHENVPRLPPPSDSLEGQLILGLFENGLAAEALAAYIYVTVDGQDAQHNSRGEIGSLIQRGKPLVDAAPIVKALPYSRVSSSKMAGAVRIAENHVQSLADEVVTAQEANASHDLELRAHLVEQKDQAKRVNNVILRLNR